MVTNTVFPICIHPPLSLALSLDDPELYQVKYPAVRQAVLNKCYDNLVINQKVQFTLFALGHVKLVGEQVNQFASRDHLS